jgi:hypothetical protein
LKDLEANPTDVAQLLSDLSFTLANGSLSGSTLGSSSGQEISVDKKGNPTLGSTVSTGWGYSISSGNTTGKLDVLGTPTAPEHLIIGPPDTSGVYSKANGSIAGDKPHNPFLNESAVFTITGSGITSDTTITSVTFSFGTTEGKYLVTGQAVPEPGSLILGTLGLGLVGVVGFCRSRRRP